MEDRAVRQGQIFYPPCMMMLRMTRSSTPSLAASRMATLILPTSSAVLPVDRIEALFFSNRASKVPTQVLMAGKFCHGPLQQKESAIKERRKEFHLDIGRTKPQYGHGLFQDLQPDNPLEVQATDSKLVFPRGLKLYSEAAYEYHCGAAWTLKSAVAFLGRNSVAL